jgi:hypothetical protein
MKPARKRPPRSYRVEDTTPEDTRAGEAAVAAWLRGLAVEEIARSKAAG